jgi:hypothetical protein
MVAGYRLGAGYGAIAGWAAPVSNIVILGLIAFYLVRLITFDAD